MACPWFYPVEYLNRAAGTRLPLPLGDKWSGVCHAASETGWTPEAETIDRLCNFGYAGGKCPRFPGEGPDAVRFSISKDQDGVIRLLWVVEKNHLPFAHGRLDYVRADERFQSPHPDARIAQQANAYVSSYLRRKGDSCRP
jgi:hypothetical protein